jgi:signal peptidase I
MDEHPQKSYDDLPKTQVARDEDLTEGGNRSIFGFSDLRGLIALIALVLFVRMSVLSPYHVPTPSMEPTIKVGDRLMALSASYDLRLPFTDIVLFKFAEPQRGDIILFRNPSDPDGDAYVKRVVAIAGDEISIRSNILHVNGKPQELMPAMAREDELSDVQDGASKQLFEENLFGHKHLVLWDKASAESSTAWSSDFPDNQKNFVVKPHSVFVLGDNRSKSKDSRDWGELPLSYVRGKALFITWSVYDRGGEHWPELRFSRFLKTLD